ncbi:hypothetical protein [Sphingobacterium anhuiense]|uniref:Telomerase reverse transcriptase n=1 Tax=Sphingobacterium anhuiense TaxID=493780 RepID=A0ABW5YY76_9SPHI
MKSRSTVEQKSSGSRKRGEEKEKKVSRSLLDVANSKSTHCPGGTRYIPAFKMLRTLFYLRPSLHRMCAVLAPSMHKGKDGVATLQVLCSYWETYYEVKRRLKQMLIKTAVFRVMGSLTCKISLKQAWYVAQASVMRMLSTGKAWIVRKTVPVYALLTHYQRFIYASSILNPYIESALFKIRSFKRSNFFSQASRAVLH